MRQFCRRKKKKKKKNHYQVIEEAARVHLTLVVLLDQPSF